MDASRSFSWFLFLGLWLSAIQVARPQAVTGNLLGKVTDASGAVVTGAGVTATEIRTGISHQVSTNSEGIYSLPYLSPGTYRVEVEMRGFKRFVSDDVELRVGTVSRIDAALQIGAATDTVEVTAQSPLLQTDSAEVSRSFSQKTVTELPFVNRS